MSREERQKSAVAYFIRPKKIVCRRPPFACARQVRTSTVNPALRRSLSKAGSGATDQKAIEPPGRKAVRADCNPAWS